MNKVTRKNVKVISIKIEGVASRKSVRDCLRRIAQILRTSNDGDLSIGWESEPLSIDIKIINEHRIDF